MGINILQPGYFGKLAKCGDFIRYNSSSQEINEFDQWLQEGLYFAKTQFNEQWDLVYEISPMYHFLFFPDNRDRFLLGVFRPSYDKSERKYPFLLSINIDREKIENVLVPLIPIVFKQFFQQAQELINRAFRGWEIEEIIDNADKIVMPIPNREVVEVGEYKQYFETTNLETFWRGLFGDFEDPRKYLLFKNLTEIILPFRDQNADRLGLGFRFPLNDGNQTVYEDVSFWIQACLSLLRNNSVLPNLFWTFPKDDNKNYLYLFFRQPSSKIFVQLVQSSLDNDNICKLEEEGMDKFTDSAQQISARDHALLDNKELLLVDFLRQL